MGAALEFVNHEADFLRFASPRTVILNDLDDTSIKQKERINEIIFTVSKDVFSNIPSCNCGKLTGAYNLGVYCDRCGTEVNQQLEAELEPLVWIRAPEGVAPFMLPRAWYMLNMLFNKSDFYPLKYLTNPNYVTTTQDRAWMHSVIAELKEQGIDKRGWNYFHENFHRIIEVLTHLTSIRKTGRKYDSFLPALQMLEMYQDCIFTRYLPVPNRSLIIIEESEIGRRRDKRIDGIIDAMRAFIGIDVPDNAVTLKTKENKVGKVVETLSNFYTDYERLNGSKENEYRKHVFGSRSHFTARAVVSSITGKHNYNELHYPWGVAVSQFRYHLINKLLKRGYTLTRAFNFLNTYSLEYHPLLDELFKELIQESPFPGIPTIFVRNPVMGYGSTQVPYITKVKTNPKDTTFGNPILTVVPWNLDFDGDQMASTLTLDNRTTRYFQALESHVSGFSMKAPFEVSDHVWLPKPVIATINNWMHDKAHDTADPVKLERMQKAFG